MRVLQLPWIVMPTFGFGIGGLSVVVEGHGPFRARTTFAPSGPPTLTLQTETASGCLRPPGKPLIECDTWAAFSDGSSLSLLSQLRTRDPAEVARIDLHENGREGRLIVRDGLTVDPLDYPLDQLLTIHLLQQHGGLLLHAACVVVNGRAFVVAGPSGQGKTTFARAASQLPGVTVLTDERVVLREHGGTWIAHGTPWVGEGKFSDPGSAPLGGVFVIDKSDRDEVSPLSPIRAMASLARCHFPAGWVGDAASQLDPLERLATSVPCYKLRTRLGGDSPGRVIASATTGALSTTDRRGGLIAELLTRGQTTQFTAFGTSMVPGIRPGDRLTVAPLRESAIEVGDVVLFRRWEQLVAHRVVGQSPLVTKGDAFELPDLPIAASDVLGRVTHVQRRPLQRMARRLRHAISRDTKTRI